MMMVVMTVRDHVGSLRYSVSTSLLLLSFSVISIFTLSRNCSCNNVHTHYWHVGDHHDGCQHDRCFLVVQACCYFFVVLSSLMRLLSHVKLLLHWSWRYQPFPHAGAAFPLCRSTGTGGHTDSSSRGLRGGFCSRANRVRKLAPQRQRQSCSSRWRYMQDKNTSTEHAPKNLRHAPEPRSRSQLFRYILILAQAGSPSLIPVPVFFPMR